MKNNRKGKNLLLKTIFTILLMIVFILLIRKKVFAWTGTGSFRQYNGLYVTKSTTTCPYCGKNAGAPVGQNLSSHPMNAKIPPTCMLEGGNATLCCHFEWSTMNYGYWYAITKVEKPLGHSYTKTGRGVAATCTKNGSYELVCSRSGCDSKKNETIYALGHDYSVLVQNSSKAATCTTEGYNTYKCTRCTDTIRRSIAKLGHNWQIYEKVQPTCVREGYVIEKCSRCKQTRNNTPGSAQGSIYAALGHNYVNGTCSRCGDKQGGSGSRRWITEVGQISMYILGKMQLVRNLQNVLHVV